MSRRGSLSDACGSPDPVWRFFSFHMCVWLCSYAVRSLFLYIEVHFAWMKCTLTYTISSCHAITSPSVMASKLREGMPGGGLLCEPYLTLRFTGTALRGIVLELTSFFPVQHRWVEMDTRPPLVKPRCPCFKKAPPLAPQPSSLAASVSWHQGLHAQLSGLWCWRNPVHPPIFRCNIHGTQFLQTCKSSVDFTLSRSDACWKEETNGGECFCQCAS